MPLFRDRLEAGKQLAQALSYYANHPDTLVIALPRGGVVVGYEVAKTLHLPLDIVCPRKIGAPFNPEYAIGAITETGEGILKQEIIKQLAIPEEYLKKAIEQETQKAQWRLDHYRKNRPPRHIENQHILLVDDGIATGSTMHAAIKSLRKEKAKELILAVPVSPPETLESLKKEVDKVFCLATPSSFFAVGQFYEIFDQTTDEEVITLLSSSHLSQTIQPL